jgi:hypothetical protein
MLTTAQVAARLNVSEDTALRIIRSLPGVFQVNLNEGSRTLYRTPETVLEAYIARKSAAKNRRTQ